MLRRNSPQRKRLRRDRDSFARNPRKRRLLFESCEERVLLAADVGLPIAEGEGEPLISVRLQPADPITLKPITSIHQGSEFLLLAYVEDLRPVPSGVFAAYLDINYPASSFQLPASNPLFYDLNFRNGIAGEVGQSGLVDEFGAFSSAAGVPGAGEQRVGGVRLTPTTTGQATFTTDAGDVSPFHDFLLFNDDNAIASDSVQHATLSLTVLEPLPEKVVTAVNDALDVPENSQDNLIDVLANDENSTGAALAITGLDTTDTRGEVTIADGGAILVYTPEEGFVGEDSFVYTAAAGAEEDAATVVINVERTTSNSESVALRYQITNQEGQPASAVTVGETFTLNVSVEDLRDLPQGVFAAFLDVQYTSSAASVTGPLVYGPAYQNGSSGNTDSAGLIDEAGAFSNIDPLGGGRFRLFSVPFEATAVGRVIFGGNPADVLPEGDILLYGEDDPVTEDKIRFDRIAVDVLPGVIAVDDSFHLLTNQIVELDVLKNDVNRGAGTMTITSVDPGDSLGQLQIINDGTAILYSPDSNFAGSEQFTYTLQGPFGIDTGTITVHRDPEATLDDLVSIELRTTDLDGSPIDEIRAGDEFLVQGYVQDLREPSADRGVFAAFFDLLYPRGNVRPVLTNGIPSVQFDGQYPNGIHLNGSVPGLLDELGAFQGDSGPLGGSPLALFSATFRATPSQGNEDTFTITEDSPSPLDVLSNDLPNQGPITFRADPSDESPLSDVLLYEPPSSVSFDQISYRDATIEITTDGGAAIVGVGATSNGGSVDISPDGLSLVYEPAANFSGIDRFTYTLDGVTSIEVAVNVLPVNDAPVASADAYRGQQDKPLQVGVNRGLLANDLDVDGDALEAVLDDGPATGDLQLEPSGAFTYQPPAGFLGQVSFTYHVTDGTLDSEPVTVELDIVPKPVSIRLQTVDAAGAAVDEIVADQPVRVRALIQDLRGSDQLFLGLGAAYLDVVYDPEQISPVEDAANSLGFNIQFDPFYENGASGQSLEGLLNDVGAFQSSFGPAGGDEVELFTVEFSVNGPRAVDDEFVVVDDSQSLLAVLENEAALRWEVSLDAQPADNSPIADVLYFNPAEIVPLSDIRYGAAAALARNGQLTIESVSETEQGANVTIVGDALRYSAPAGYVGTDTFTYTVSDASGRMATATVSIEVGPSWQNPVDPVDVSGDGVQSPLDALIVINLINELGSFSLDAAPTAADNPVDVNGDGVVSAIDALIVINSLATQAAAEAAAEGEGSASALLPDARRFVVNLNRSPLKSVLPLSPSIAPAKSFDPRFMARSALNDNAFSPVSTRNATAGRTASDGLPDEPEDLLEALAADIAPLWNDIA